jgi:hypothetical protein
MGMRRRSAANASRAFVASFSWVKGASRAAVHSSAETIGGRFMEISSSIRHA